MERPTHENVEPTSDLAAHFAAATNNLAALSEVAGKSRGHLNKLDSEGKSPLFYAVSNHHVEAMELLLQHRAKVNLPDSTGQVPLHVAAFDGFSQGLQLLVENGAKTQVRDVNGRLPLHLSTNSQDIKCMVYLLSDCRKDQVNMRDHEGMTALHWASFHKRPNHLKALLRKGAREDVVDVDQKSPLHWAAQNGSPMCCQMLLMSRSQSLVNYPDKNGNSCLHLAAAGGHCNVVKVLARVEGVNLAARDNNGRTPLHWAAAAGHDATCEALINFKCDPLLKDKSQKTPYDYAKANRSAAHKKCAKLLKNLIKGRASFDGTNNSLDATADGADAAAEPDAKDASGQSMKTLAKISRALIAIKARGKGEEPRPHKARGDDRDGEKEGAAAKKSSNNHRRSSNVSQSSLTAVSEEDINALEAYHADGKHTLSGTMPLPGVGAADATVTYSDVVLPNPGANDNVAEVIPALRSYEHRPTSREVPALRPRNSIADTKENQDAPDVAELKQLRNRVNLLEMELAAVKAHDTAKNDRIATLEEHVQFWKREAQMAPQAAGDGRQGGSPSDHSNLARRSSHNPSSEGGSHRSSGRKKSGSRQGSSDGRNSSDARSDTNAGQRRSTSKGKQSLAFLPQIT